MKITFFLSRSTNLNICYEIIKDLEKKINEINVKIFL